jgi:hypothetical protein
MLHFPVSFLFVTFAYLDIQVSPDGKKPILQNLKLQNERSASFTLFYFIFCSRVRNFLKIVA